MKALRYAWSWLHAEAVGHTVCRIVGHRRPSADHVEFQLMMADLFRHGPDSDLRRLTCQRCGGYLPEEVSKP